MLKYILLLLFPILAYSQGVVRIGTASGTDTYAVTFNPAITSLNTNTIYTITFTNANTSTTVTLDPAGAVAATAIKDNTGADPAIGSIKAGGTYNLKYTGSNFRVIETISETATSSFTDYAPFDYVTKTTNYTPVATDTLTNRAFLMKAAGALTFTIPPNGTTPFFEGTSFLVIADTTDVLTVTLTEGSGVTFVSNVSGTLTLTNRQSAVISKINSTNLWHVFIGENTAMTNPMTTAGDIITGGASGTPTRLGIGSALNVLRVNAGATALEWSAPFTNTAAANEIPKSDGTNLDPSGVFSDNSGDLQLGTGVAGTERVIEADGSGSNVGLRLSTKGTGVIEIGSASQNGVILGTFPGSGGFMTFKAEHSDGTALMEDGFDESANYGGTPTAITGRTFFLYDYVAAAYRMGMNPSGDFYIGPSSSTFGFRFLQSGDWQVTKTVTGGGTTGNQTINKLSGTVNFAAAATTLTVTNSFVTTSSIVFAVVRTNDTTAAIKNVVPAAGSFVITLSAAATAETSVGFFVVN